MSGYVGRLAPSPTGALHLGNARTFMIAWLRARSLGGKVILRMEDLDHPRDRPGAAARALEDLEWLGFDWDEEYAQSERTGIYRRALDAVRDLVYPCVCTRRDVDAAQSAPHDGEQLFYPGICRGRFASWKEAEEFKTQRLSREGGLPPGAVSPPCWRFRVPAGATVAFDDAFAGRFSADVSKTLGDFPLARDESGAGYMFACTVDDLDMGVTEVVRGDDLLACSPAQILLARALLGRGAAGCGGAARVPGYCHVPLVVGGDGRRLAKRHGDTRIAAFRERGESPGRILGALAASCGWADRRESLSLGEILPRFNLGTIPRGPFMI